MSSEVALEGDDVGPPGVDEPAPPGMEEEEAPPGVEAEKTETKTEASTAAAVTDSTGPVSSEALAYGGYGSYGAYDPAGYGYDPNLWNYYSTGSYFPGAYPGAPSAGYGYAGYTGYYDPATTAAYDASSIPAPVGSVETAHAVQVPPPAPPATPASASSNKTVAVTAAAAPPPPAEVPPGAPPTPPGAASSSVDAPVVTQTLAVEAANEEPQVQVVASAVQPKPETSSVALQAQQPSVLPAPTPVPKPVPSGKENGPEALRAQLEAKWAGLQAAAAAEAEMAKKDQETEPETQKVLKAKPLPVMLKGAKLAVSQPAAATQAAPRPVAVATPVEQPARATAPPAPKPAVTAPKPAITAPKPAKQGLYLPESISAIAARIQQADELQARRARWAQSASPQRSRSRSRSRSRVRSRSKTPPRVRAASPRQPEGRVFRSRHRRSPLMNNSRSVSKSPLRGRSGYPQAPSAYPGPYGYEYESYQYDRYDPEEAPYREEPKRKEKRKEKKEKRKHRRRHLDEYGQAQYDAEDPNGYPSEGLDQQRSPEHVAAAPARRATNVPQYVEREFNTANPYVLPAALALPVRTASPLPSPPRIGELRARRASGGSLLKPRSPTPTSSPSPPPGPRTVQPVRESRLVANTTHLSGSSYLNHADSPISRAAADHQAAAQKHQMAGYTSFPIPGAGSSIKLKGLPGLEPTTSLAPASQSAAAVSVDRDAYAPQARRNKVPLQVAEAAREALLRRQAEEAAAARAGVSTPGGGDVYGEPFRIDDRLEASRGKRYRDRPSDNYEVQGYSPEEDRRRPIKRSKHREDPGDYFPETYTSEDERRRAKKEKKRLKREKKAARQRNGRKVPSYSPEPEPYPARRQPPAYYQHDPRDASPVGAGSYRRAPRSPTPSRSRTAARSMERSYSRSYSRSPSRSRSPSPSAILPERNAAYTAGTPGFETAGVSKVAQPVSSWTEIPFEPPPVKKEVPTLSAGVGMVSVPSGAKTAQTAPPSGFGGLSAPHRPDQFTAGNKQELQNAAPAASVAAHSAYPQPSKASAPPVDGQNPASLAAKPAANGAAPQRGEREEGEASPPKVSAVLQLSNMVVREELLDPEEYEDFVDDVRGEIEEKYGLIKDFHIPKPAAIEAEDPPGFGFVFVQFVKEDDAIKAQTGLNGRKFGRGRVAASFFDVSAFVNRNFADSVGRDQSI